jgi:DNA-nicking Smr family endonuclease
MRQRLARGTHELDARLDLHGMTQAHAHGALLHFLRSAQAGDARIVLVITGKGARGADAGAERGVLRRQVPLWLRLPEFRAYVVGFETATATHGGDGALYVRLRRKR